MKLNIEADFEIYKIGDLLFQIDNFLIEENLFKNIIYILNLGNKFVPNYFFESFTFFNYLLMDIDKQLIEFNKQIVYFKSKNNNINHLDDHFNQTNEVDNDHLTRNWFNKFYRTLNIEKENSNITFFN